MNIIEIRYNKKWLVPFMVFIIAVILASNYYTFSSEKYKDNIYFTVFLILLDVSGVYGLIRFAKRLKENKPVIVLTDKFIEINEKDGPAILMWNEINSLTAKDDDGGRSLILETKRGQKKISLNWLDKSPGQIESLIHDHFNTYHTNKAGE